MNEPSITRKYSLAEIDQMRKDIASLQQMDRTKGTAYYPESEYEKVETNLRTYMMAGIDPRELRSKVILRTKQRQEKNMQEWAER